MLVVWLVPIAYKGNDRAWTKGEGKRTISGGGGPKPLLGRGPMVCFPLS